jgi:hypothetical protein
LRIRPLLASYDQETQTFRKGSLSRAFNTNLASFIGFEGFNIADDAEIRDNKVTAEELAVRGLLVYGAKLPPQSPLSPSKNYSDVAMITAHHSF